MGYKRISFWAVLSASIVVVALGTVLLTNLYSKSKMETKEVAKEHFNNEQNKSYSNSLQNKIVISDKFEGNFTSSGKPELDMVIPKVYKNQNGSTNVDMLSVSPDGKYAISSIVEQGKVLIYDTLKNTLAASFDLLAQDYEFLWSQDSTKVCVVQIARVWKTVSILDIASEKIIESPSVTEIKNAIKENGMELNYIMNENRSDPYITPIKWFSDNTKILLSYQWTDSEYMRQSGTFVFDVDSLSISDITQNAPIQEG